MPKYYGKSQAVYKRFIRWECLNVWSGMFIQSTDGADLQEVMVDGLGNPLKFILTGGTRNEIIKAEALIEDIKDTNVLTDKAYDSDTFRHKIEVKGCKHIIPPRKNSKIQHEYDKHIYVDPHLVECFFSKLKQFRRVFSRFNKIKHTFQAFINFASTLINLR